MTPPMGLPKATPTPAAADALKISLVFDAFRLYFSNIFEMTLPVHTAKCTLGPSLPIDKPEEMASGNARDLMRSVQKPRNPFITKPAMMHLISDIPEPAAYGAKDFTSRAEEKAKRAAKVMYNR